MKHKNRALLRIFFVGALFIAICGRFVIRLINIGSTSDPAKIQTGTYQREEIIEAQRGEIYDREGRLLVSNSYSYDLTIKTAVGEMTNHLEGTLGEDDVIHGTSGNPMGSFDFDAVRGEF